MAQNNSTSTVDTIASSKPGLITDINPTYAGKENYSHARNAVRNSKDGDLGTISDEPSTILCFEAPYKVLGHVDLPDGTKLIFSGDGASSEIGIGDPKKCTYTTLKNLDCFTFSPDHPIKGVAKKDFAKGVQVTFTDKFNPVRRIDLSKLDDITCDNTLLFKKIDHPCISARRGEVGNMPNGMYSVAIAYAIDNQVFSDYLSISNRVPLYSENGANSLEVEISGLDEEFDQFALIVVGSYVDPTTKGATKLAKQVGIFSTKIKKISISDFINSTYIDVPLSSLVIKKNTWQKAGIITANSNYLILADLVGRDEENYQLKAMSIETEYVVEQVEANYYENDGRDVGYYGDENYDFYIQGVYSSGELTDKFHIPGRKATSRDRSIVSSADVYEHDEQFADCEPEEKIERWRVENTAGELIPTNDPFVCKRRILGKGKMGYFESTDVYPDNKDMFGEDANTPIRYHKFPDECKVPRYQTIDGKTYINIKGVRFKKIPNFDNPDIVGYKITRSDRKGGNGTVIARGLLTNMRSYNDQQLNQEVLFANYPVNDLSPDQFLSSTQTSFRNNKEHNFTPITGHLQDKFSFYSPHTLFEPRYTLGSELKIEAEEIASVSGQFEKVHNHPRMKLLNQFSFWLAAAVGFIESALILMGKDRHFQGKTFTIKTETTAGTPPSVTITTEDTNISGREFNIRSVEDLVGLDIVEFVKSKVLAKDLSAITVIKNAIKAILAAGIKVPYSILGGIVQAEEIFNTIYNFTGYTDYVYQYNAYAKFDRSICVADGSGNKRRRLLDEARYIPSDVVSIDDVILNNYFREKFVYLHVNKPIKDTQTKDSTRNTASGFGVCDDMRKKTVSTGVAYYATSKTPNPNQYGRLGSSAPVSMHGCTLSFSNEEFTTSPILYGGDCIIARFQFMKKMQFFNQNLANTNYMDGTEYDYRFYRNIAYPRFWMDTSKYDFSQLLSKNIVNFTTFSRTTAGKHNLDCKKRNDGKSISRIDDAYMYLSNNCVVDFFVECDYNIHFRESTDVPHYSKKSSNITQLFRSDRLELQEKFEINRVFSDLYTTEIYAQQQRFDFDPANPTPVAQPNSIIYSLPSFNLQNIDNWQYFLPANYFSFRESDFGKLTGVHKMDQDRIIFLFSNSSPYISMGRDILELDGTGRKVTIGDGGLFAQDPREIMPSDNNYGACNSPYAFVNSHLGRYYPSERQGRILMFTDSLDDVSRQGMSYWCKNYMPIRLYDYFPDYPQEENPISGVGYLMAFDSFNETVYLTKRDFSPKKELISHIEYSPETGFTYKGDKISLRDSSYFNDISWTLSYSPLEKAFISWHDWHPDWIIQTENHFMSVKDNAVWKHNEAYDSHCNFYGKDYPFEIEFLSSAGQTVETVRSLEYLLEVYRYKNGGRDRFHVLNENFDRLIVHNTEQISPLLNLTLGNPDPRQNLQFPKKNPLNNVSYDVVFFKEENKYRVNQFWDACKDRGEFSLAEHHLFPTDESGYKSVVNPVAIDVNKPEEQRKKFRHYWNKFRLIKSIPGGNKFIVKLLNVKKQISIR